MVIKTFISILCLLVSTLLLQGQVRLSLDDLDRKAQKKYKKATELIQEKSYYKAIKLLAELADSYPCVHEVRAKLGWQYLRRNNTDGAINEFDAALKLSDTPDYKIVFELSKLYEERDSFAPAIETVDRLIGSIDSTNRIWDFTLRRKAELLFREDAYAHPLPVKPVALGPQVNTEYSEFLPAFNAMGTEMIFTRRLPGYRGVQEDLYICRIDSTGTLNNSQAITELNTPENEGAHCFSQDGNILIFTACDRMQSHTGCDLYISFRRMGSWSSPVNMGPVINTRYWESQPALSPDNQTLYFSSTRKGGYGGKDIWKSRLTSTGWSEPQNLGPKINGPGNEGSPFLHADGTTLYFRSDGHIGLGEYDLFLSRLTGDSWSEPLNLGYPINSKYSEGALFVELNGKKAYYTSDQYNTDRNLDILSFELPEKLRPEKTSYLLLEVRDAISKKPLSAQLKLTTVTETMESRVLQSGADGKVLVPLKLGEYMINLQYEGYLPYSKNLQLLEVSRLDKPYRYLVELTAEPSEAGQDSESFILNNIFFESGSARLLNKSIPEIESLASLLINRDFTVTITGHTDNVGSEEDNLELSRQRAKAVRDVLVDLGVNENQIRYEGKGESEPVTDNSTEEGQAKNRRTEFQLQKRG